jgi:hypothetical protein
VDRGQGEAEELELWIALAGPALEFLLPHVVRHSAGSKTTDFSLSPFRVLCLGLGKRKLRDLMISGGKILLGVL